jgi:8-oxo-dGTP pyrophosphatase MutT (NUDIX family)
MSTSGPKLAAWQVLEDRPLIERHWLTVREQRIGLPHGGTIEAFHLIEGPHWGAVLALTDDARVVLVRQYRHGSGGISVELPAGVIEPGEEPLEAVRRELVEETGYSAGDWRPLLSAQTEPARHTTRAHFFFASGAKPVAEPELDASEQIETFTVPAPELFELIERGEIVHAVHIAAILTAARRGWLPG